MIFIFESRHESSSHSPFEVVVFGRNPILPVDINEGLVAKPLPTDMNDDNTRKALEVLTNNRIKIIESVCLI